MGINIINYVACPKDLSISLFDDVFSEYDAVETIKKKKEFKNHTIIYYQLFAEQSEEMAVIKHTISKGNVTKETIEDKSIMVHIHTEQCTDDEDILCGVDKTRCRNENTLLYEKFILKDAASIDYVVYREFGQTWVSVLVLYAVPSTKCVRTLILQNLPPFPFRENILTAIFDRNSEYIIVIAQDISVILGDKIPVVKEGKSVLETRKTLTKSITTKQEAISFLDTNIFNYFEENFDRFFDVREIKGDGICGPFKLL
jgi:hypothetical protein